MGEEDSPLPVQEVNDHGMVELGLLCGTFHPYDRGQQDGHPTGLESHQKSNSDIQLSRRFVRAGISQKSFSCD